MPASCCLEVVDLEVGALPLLGSREALDPLHQHAAVPGAVVDRHVARSRDVAPEAPQVVLRLLLVGGRGDRDARGRRAASIAAVRRRIAPPLPAASQPSNTTTVERFFSKAARASRPSRPCAFAEPLVVLGLGQLPLQVHPVEDGERASGSSRGRDGAARGERSPSAGRCHRQPAAETLEQRPPGHHVAVALVGGLDQQPGRVARVGRADRVLGGLDVHASYLRKCFQSAFVDPPARGRRSPSRRRRRLLGSFFERWIQSLTISAPSSASICSKKATSDSIRRSVARLRRAEGPLDERLACTTSRRRCRCGRAGGSRHPVAPPPRPLPLLVGRRRRRRGCRARACRATQDARHRLALAGPIGPGQEHDHGTPASCSCSLRLQQLEAQLRQFGLEPSLPTERPSSAVSNTPGF